MRIDSQMPIDTSKTTTNVQKSDKGTNMVYTVDISLQNEQKQSPKETIPNAVEKLNEILEVHNNRLKFVYHEELEEYYVEEINSQTDEVIREIPSKELLDDYYQMQKIIGNIIDKKV